MQAELIGLWTPVPVHHDECMIVNDVKDIIAMHNPGEDNVSGEEYDQSHNHDTITADQGS
jgi:hypothetical protein